MSDDIDVPFHIDPLHTYCSTKMTKWSIVNCSIQLALSPRLLNKKKKRIHTINMPFSE